MAKMIVKKFDDGALIPTLGREGDAGIDLHALKDYTIFPGETVAVETGIGAQLKDQDNYVLLVMGRGGLSCKGFDVSAGVGDENFGGQYCAVMQYHAPTGPLNIPPPYEIKKGDKIAQIVPVPRIPIDEIIEVEEFEETERGESAWGSSGD